jgi:hypothetical protein
MSRREFFEIGMAVVNERPDSSNGRCSFPTISEAAFHNLKSKTVLCFAVSHTECLIVSRTVHTEKVFPRVRKETRKEGRRRNREGELWTYWQ